MEHTDKKKSNDYAFYHEYCLLKILKNMGYLKKRGNRRYYSICNEILSGDNKCVVSINSAEKVWINSNL